MAKLYGGQKMVLQAILDAQGDRPTTSKTPGWSKQEAHPGRSPQLAGDAGRGRVHQFERSRRIMEEALGSMGVKRRNKERRLI